MRKCELKVNSKSIKKLEFFLNWFNDSSKGISLFEQSLIYHKDLELEYDEDMDAYLRPAMYYENIEGREKYLRYETIYINFFSELYDKYDVFILDSNDYQERPLDKNEVSEYYFHDKHEFIEYIRSCLRKRLWFISHFICLSSLDHIIYINFDLVLINFQIENDENFIKIVEKHSLISSLY